MELLHSFRTVGAQYQGMAILATMFGSVQLRIGVLEDIAPAMIGLQNGVPAAATILMVQDLYAAAS